MRYGIGTGRSGTLSLAREIGAVHEPHPGLTRRMRVPAARKVIQARIDAGLPSVDRLQSFHMATIEELDPDAYFLWLVRNPTDCIRSMRDTGHEGCTTIEQAAQFYKDCNMAIFNHIFGRQNWAKNYELIQTEWDLERQIGQSKKPSELTDKELAIIEDSSCINLWQTIVQHPKVNRRRKETRA